MSAQPVDVLAVLRATSAGLHSVANSCSRSDLSTPMRSRAEEFDRACAAVAELLNALADFDGMAEPSMPGTPPKLRRLREAYARMEPQA